MVRFALVWLAVWAGVVLGGEERDAHATRMSELIDLIAVSATTKQEADIDKALEALARATEGLPLNAENTGYFDMLQNASHGDAAALYRLARYFCGAPPVPNPKRCEFLLRIAVDCGAPDAAPLKELLGQSGDGGVVTAALEAAARAPGLEP